MFDDPAAASGVAHLDLTGVRLGPFQIIEEVAEGGMGTVYRAQRVDGAFDQTVALKLLRIDVLDEHVHQRFLRERRILARLDHPHIAHLLDGGVTSDGRPWLALPFIHGVSITEHCDRERLGIVERIGLLLQVCEAIAYSHRRLVIHRDIKPSNVLVDDQGQVKVLDFSIAKPSSSGNDAGLHTEPSLTPLTPMYAAPEQLAGADTGTATDIYQLGLLLHELLVGEPARRRSDTAGDAPLAPRPAAEVYLDKGLDSVEAQRCAQLRGVDPRTLLRWLSGDLGRVLACSLDPDPLARYRDVADLARDLRAVLAMRPIEARTPSRSYVVGLFLRRHRAIAIGASLALVCILALSALAFWHAHQAQLARAEAEQRQALAERSKRLMIELFSASDPANIESAGPGLTVRELLDDAGRRLRLDRSLPAPVLAELLSGLAASHLGLGDATQALEMLNEASAMLSVVPVGSNAPDSSALQAEIALVMARAELLRGELEQAQQQLARAGPYFESIAARGNPLQVDYLVVMANALNYDSRYDESNQVADRAIDLAEELHGADSRVALQTRIHAGMLASFAEHHERAELLLRDAYRRVELATSSLQDPLRLDALAGLGLALDVAERPSEAVPLLRQAAELTEAHFGSQHQRLASRSTDLGNALQDAGQLDAAIAAYEKALAIYDQRGEPKSIQRGYSLNNLGYAYLQAEQFERAWHYLRQAHALWAEQLGVEHDHTLIAASHAGYARARAVDAQAGERDLRENLEQRRRLEHPYVASTERYLARLLIDRGALDEARRLLEQAREAFFDPSRYGDLSRAQFLYDLGLLELASGQAALAREHFVRADEHYRLQARDPTPLSLAIERQLVEL